MFNGLQGGVGSVFDMEHRKKEALVSGGTTDPPTVDKSGAGKSLVKKMMAKSVNRGWVHPGYDWKPSSGDISVRDKSLPLLKTKIDYLLSPLYKRRLLLMGELNPKKVINDRVEALKNIEFYRGAKGSSSTQDKAWAGSTSVTIAAGADDATVDHELGHVTSSVKEFSTNLNEGGANFMSPAEAWKIINSDKSISNENKKAAWEGYKNNAKLGYLSTDPTAQSLQGDVHEFGAGEAKGDLDSMRGILYRNGYTKNFGEDLDINKLQKALKDPKVNNNPFIQRLLKRFSEENIIKLNNTVAVNEGENKTLSV